MTEETALTSEPLVESALDADRAVTSAAEAGLPAVVLRLGTVYGRHAWHTQILAQQANGERSPSSARAKPTGA